MLSPLIPCPTHYSSIHTSKAALSEPTLNITQALKYLGLIFITSEAVINRTFVSNSASGALYPFSLPHLVKYLQEIACFPGVQL